MWRVLIIVLVFLGLILAERLTYARTVHSYFVCLEQSAFREAWGPGKDAREGTQLMSIFVSSGACGYFGGLKAIEVEEPPIIADQWRNGPLLFTVYVVAVKNKLYYIMEGIEVKEV